MKDWHLCLGDKCSRDSDFEDYNCAEPIETADPEDPLSLGVGEPGCEIIDEYCDNGLFPPCSDTVVVEYSAEVKIDWPEIKTSDYIE